MQSKPIPVLLTRPAAASARFGLDLKARLGRRVELVQSPLMTIEPCVASIDLGGFEGVVFTSSNAVRVASDLGVDPSLPAYCLGHATTTAATASGWRAEQHGTDAQTLITALLANRPQAPLIHLTGVHTRGDVAAHLTGQGVQTEALAIYDQPFLPLSPLASALLVGGTSMIVPLFSPRSAAQFCATAPYSDCAVTIAMSDAIAQSMSGPWRPCSSVANEPTAKAMLEAVEMYVNRLSRVERTDAGQ